jgi:hypothetical protein
MRCGQSKKRRLTPPACETFGEALEDVNTKDDTEDVNTKDDTKDVNTIEFEIGFSSKQ